MFLRLSILFFIFLHIISVQLLHAETNSIQTSEVEVLFEKPLANLAQEVIKAYTFVKNELAETFHWEIDFKPKVILVKDKDTFKKITGSDIILAFAVPDRNLIVLDTSRVYIKPFTLETTLKHELCHLILHRNIEQERLPRWLDEGVCQWSSGGIAELMTDSEGRALTKATISDRLIDIGELDRFPMDEKSLILAYEQSKSFVEYIVSEYGKDKMLDLLGNLKTGYPIHEAIQKSLSISLFELEKNWHAYLKRKHTWFLYLSNNLYAIIFFLAALVTVYGFIRLLKKKRAYKDEEEEEERGNKDFR
jgi:hypothetical protein